MNFTLQRKYFKETYTIGVFYRDDRYFKLCETLEPPVRELNDLNHDGDFDDPGEGKIWGETAIPCGTYELTLNYSEHFDRDMIYLSDVPGFSYIMIHGGNTSKDTKGCILVGENRVKGQVVNSRYWEAVIKNLVREDEENGIKSYLTIKQ